MSNNAAEATGPGDRVEENVAVLIVTYQTGPILFECLDRIAEIPGITEIIVVDNGNSNADLAALRKWETGRAGRKLLTGHGNIGFGAGVNLAARAAEAPLLLVLNPDVILEHGALAALQSDRHGLTEPFMLGGALFDAEGREQAGARREALTLWRAFCTLSGLSLIGRIFPFFRGIDARRGPLPAIRTDFPVVSGAMFLMSAPGFRQLDGFDEGYFLHVEDIDLCHRARAAGGRVALSPGARGFHARSVSRAPKWRVEMHKADGFARFFRDRARSWPEKCAVEFLLPILRAGLFIRAMVWSVVSGRMSQK